jgi:RHS repeat-associated protein
VWRWDEDYIYRGSQLLAAEVPGNTLHFHLDHLGTPRVITGNGGVRIATHTYFPFGRELTPPGSERMKFTGHERDAINLEYMHARSYLPWTGRFLSVDPVNSADPALPQSWNRYAYAFHNPINFTDPTGLYTVNCGGLSDDDCKAQTDAFEQSLESQRGSRDSEVAAAAGVYGALGDDNGVVVEFVANLTHNGRSANGTHFASFGVDPNGNALINHNIQIATGLSASDLALAAVHEGKHALTANLFGQSVIAGSPNDALNLSMYDAEMAAYLLTGRFVNVNQTDGGRGVEYNGLRIRPGMAEGMLRRDIDRYLRGMGLRPGIKTRGMCQWSAFCAD